MLVQMNGKNVYVCERTAKIGMLFRAEELGSNYPLHCTDITAETTDDGETVFLCCFVGTRFDDPRELFMFFSNAEEV